MIKKWIDHFGNYIAVFWALATHRFTPDRPIPHNAIIDYFMVRGAGVLEAEAHCKIIRALDDGYLKYVDGVNRLRAEQIQARQKQLASRTRRHI